MMDAINQLIQNVGFPIVAFLLMWQMATKTMKENTRAINKLGELIRIKLK